MAIVKLDPTVLGNLVSQVTITSYTDAIRELIENSVDAGADEVFIRLDMKSLSAYVSDNGRGISCCDLENVAQRHYTSKVTNSDQYVDTYGYRGEALHALSLVSTLTIVSKTVENDTFQLFNGHVRPFRADEQIKNDLFAVEPIELSGTTVKMTNIFSDVPVRRAQQLNVAGHKVIESIQHVLAHILAKRPALRIQLHKIDTEPVLVPVLHLKPVTGSVFEQLAGILRSIFGPSVLASYETLQASYKRYKLTGIIGTAPISTRVHQYILLNGRPVEFPDKRLNRLFDHARFGADLASPTKTKRRPFHRFPIYLVNVQARLSVQELAHMTYSTEMLDLLESVFTSFLRSYGYAKQPSTSCKSVSPTKPLKSPSKKVPKHDVLKLTRSPSKLKTPPLESYDPVNVSRSELEDYFVVGQVDMKFILVKTKRNTLMVLDQHACDERIRVERLLQEFINQMLDPGLNISLRLLEPLQFATTDIEHNLYSVYQQNLNTLGIAYDQSDHYIQITHLPHILVEKTGDDAEFLRSCLSQHLYDLSHHIKHPKLPSSSDWFDLVRFLPRVILDLINSKACRSSIMFGDLLTKPQMQSMLDDLLKCNVPFQCAHGRPSIVPLLDLNSI